MENVIIFGRGKYFKKKYCSIIQNFHIVALLDNAVQEKEYDSEYQCMVYNPNECQKLEKCSILCMSLKFYDMCRQLIDLGIPIERIMAGTEIFPYFDYCEELMCQKGIFQITSEGVAYLYNGNSYLIRNEYDLKKIKRNVLLSQTTPFKNLGTHYISRAWGSDLGKPVDRVYIESFLSKNSEDIHGDVMEIGDDIYTRTYGGTKVSNGMVMHVDGLNNALKIDLETGDGIRDNLVDCFICTQTLFYIYDLKSVVCNIYKLLKPNGVALVTVPGISRIGYGEWGDYWRFTTNSLRRLFEKTFGKENLEVESFGNVKTASAFLYGLCAEQLEYEDFLYNDERCQMIVAARMIKKIM